MKIELGYWGCPNCGTSKVIVYGDKKRQCNGCGRKDIAASRIHKTGAFNEQVAQ